jgi:hypothetical protein
MEQIMKTSNLLLAAAALSATLLNACSADGSQFSPSAATTTASAVVPQGRHQGPSPASCLPKLWTTSLSTNAVYGYTAANSTPCITLNGVYAGLSFNAPISVTVWKKYLYVADLNNYRVVVFTITGSYVKYFSTALAGTSYEPWGVCVSTNGVVGVGNRNGIDSSGNTVDGNVEFWNYNAATGSTPTGSATTILQNDQFCAFDVRGNFYVDGTAFTTAGGGQQIAYLPSGIVNAGAQILCNSGQGNAHFWTGMFSKITSPVSQTLSVGGAIGSSGTQDLFTFPVTGSGTSCSSVVFGSPATYLITPYPITVDPLYQLAPKHAPANPSSPLFIADYGDNKTLRSTIVGGPAGSLESVSATTGVAAQPSGEY